MSMTEEEAKTKWCPHVRVSNGPDGTWNKFDVGVASPSIYTCIGSACMAWRFAFQQPERGQVYEESDTPDECRPSRVPPSWKWTAGKERGTSTLWVHRWTEPEAEHEARKVGFCGLAGAPQ